MFMSMSRILDEIRIAIEKSSKSRYRLSKDAGIPESQLSRLMTGEKGLSFDSLDRLAEALGLEVVIQPKRATKGADKRKAKNGKRDK
jgi:transcriptional regulator with XRE-family HTH domain